MTVSGERSEVIKRRNRSFVVLPGHISAILLSNSGRVPLKNISYQLRLAPGRSLEGTTDGDGFLSHPDVPQGYYDMELPEFSCTFRVPSVPLDTQRCPVRVPIVLFPHAAGAETLPEYGDDLQAGRNVDDGGWEDLDDE